MRDNREKWARIRIRVIGTLFAVFFVIIAARAFYLQIVKKDDWTRRADRQHQKIVPLTPARGTIYDSTGAALAVSIEMDSCFAEPDGIESITDAAARLAPLLNLTREQLEKKLHGNKNFVWVQRHITPDLVKKIKDLDIEGIGFVKETRRFYPNSEVAAHVIGFTGLDPEGLEGIELKYNTLMLGNTGYLITERDALGRDIALKGQVVKKSSKGADIVLTLDKNIQYIAEKELAKAVTGSGAKAGIAVVMDPQTGKVLAMANYPDFNPNSYRQRDVHGNCNRACSKYVIKVETTQEFRLNSYFSTWRVQYTRNARSGKGYISYRNPGIGNKAIGYNRTACSPCDKMAERVIDIHYRMTFRFLLVGCQQVAKETLLAGPVGRHIFVVVEVITGEIGEYGDIKLAAVYPALLQSV